MNRNDLSSAFSDKDLHYYFPTVPVLRYPDMVRMAQSGMSLRDIMGPEQAMFLLYETKERNGHWTLVFRRPSGTIETFDSYGYSPDGELSLIPPSYRKQSKQNHTHLIQLLLKDGNGKKAVEYNSDELQELVPGINTCGRHCVNRLLFRHMPIEKYVKMMKSSNNPDKIVGNGIPKIDL